jgi:hypothetical protein
VLNAYRFALEQRKPLATFAPLAAGETTGNAVIAPESPRRRQESLLASDRISSRTYFPRATTSTHGTHG